MEGYLEEFKDYKNIDEDDEDYDEDEILASSEFLNFVEDQLSNDFQNVKYDIGRTIKNGHIPIYRSMTVKSNWFKNLKKHKHLGIYWSWSKHAAESHWGHFGKDYREIKLVSKIKENYVDWIDTFQLNIMPGTGYEEKEIRLFKNTPIKLDAILVGGKPIDISEIKDKVFRA